MASLALVLALAVATAGSTVGQTAGQPLGTGRCKAPKQLVRFNAPLPNMRRALVTRSEFRIAAIGSSSTAGTGASSPRMRYPLRLEAELNRRFDPDRNFIVSNLGVGGQLASDMLARMPNEVLPLEPQLVIWQTGVNDAIRGVPLPEFEATLGQGVDLLKSRRIDVILLDLQYYPRSEQVPGYLDYVRTMRKVAREKDVPILHRFAIMKHLIASGQFTPPELLSADLFHLNDVSYGCLSALLADAIEDGLAVRSRELVKEAMAR
ncbi:MAG TPA: SGNH/GDSL hydrolase family protein [Hyphomicrobiaceae bacterium]|nr:SGNH/GDSL hydrolase family protein [Hyphomicrobiaceae bacterium]